MAAPSGIAKRADGNRPAITGFGEWTSAVAAQARVFLKRLNNFHEVVESDDPFELEAGLAVGNLDQMRLDAADRRQADDNPLAPR